MTRILLLIIILIGTLTCTYRGRQLRPREGLQPAVRHHKHSLTTRRLQRPGLVRENPGVKQRRRRRRRLGMRRSSDYPVMSRQLGIELRTEREKTPRTYSNFFETGNLNSIRMTPIKKDQSTLLNYPRYTNWNKYRISQVTTSIDKFSLDID